MEQPDKYTDRKTFNNSTITSNPIHQIEKKINDTYYSAIIIINNNHSQVTDDVLAFLKYTLHQVIFSVAFLFVSPSRKSSCFIVNFRNISWHHILMNSAVLSNKNNNIFIILNCIRYEDRSKSSKPYSERRIKTQHFVLYILPLGLVRLRTLWVSA